MKKFKNNKPSFPSPNVTDVSYLLSQSLEEEFILWHNACYDTALSVITSNLSKPRSYPPRRTHNVGKVIPFKDT